MSFIFPKPRDWNAFEDIVCDVFARKYQNLNLQRYGRSGQRQHGVDIAGLTNQGLLGVQCKHHPQVNIPISEIDDEVKKSEGFTPRLDEYVIATSADRDERSRGHVLNIAEQREEAGQYPVSIKYWDDICDWLVEYPDLVYKHFTKFYPQRELEHLYLSALLDIRRETLRWPFAEYELFAHITASLDGVAKIDPYMLAVGLATFDETDISGRVDVEISLAGLINAETQPENGFVSAAAALRQFREMAHRQFFARTVLIYPQVRLSYAFLVGWMFRKVSGFDLMVVAGDEVWPSKGMILTPTLLSDDFPLIYDAQSAEVALVLNISRDVKPSVIEFVESWKEKPKAILSYRLEGNRIESAAHALSLSLDISRRIKNLIDGWGVRKIHLFGALPAALAVLIGHHLNAICPIHLYFLDDARSSYQLGGTISNSL